MKIFSDRTIIPGDARHCDLMIPFWGHYGVDNGYRHLETWLAFRHFEIWAREHWDLAPAHQADIAVLPFDGAALLHGDRHARDVATTVARRFVGQAEQAGLRTIVQVRSDSNEQLPLDDRVIVLRHSLDRRTRRTNEHSLFETFQEFLPAQPSGSPVLRPHRDVPTVGFCGFAAPGPPPLKRRIREQVARLADRVPGCHLAENDGQHLRRRAITALESSPLIHTNIVARTEPFFGTNRDRSTNDELRRTYTENMLQSDYMLCVRGRGNHSVRFFETMSLGRIPVLVDTDCVLPYDTLHDYRELCVVVPAAEVSTIGNHINDHHHRFTPDSFRERQLAIHRFWERWLSPRGYCSNLERLWRPDAPLRPAIRPDRPLVLDPPDEDPAPRPRADAGVD